MIELPGEDTAKCTVGDYIAQWLARSGIRQVFTLPGGMIATVLDAIHRLGGTELVTMHHEQAVAFAADGVGRFAGTPAVALATAGPGATNMLTAIGSAYLDSVPAIFLVGQVQTYLLKRQRDVRQYGLQECDVVAMARPVTKAAWRVLSAAEVPGVLAEALVVATTGRPGPVLIELPADVQAMGIGDDAWRGPGRASAARLEDTAPVQAMLTAIERAARPLVLLGGGVNAARAAGACRAFVAALNAPVAASVTALDVLAASDPRRLGMIGMYGNRWVNVAASEADVVLVLGSRLDFGTIGADVVAWGRPRTVFQVDCDPGEMERVRGVRPVVADLGAFFDAAVPLASQRRFPGWPGWWDRVRELRAAWPDTEELAGCPGINPNMLVRQLSDASSPAAAFVIDAGQHLWWACQSIQPRLGQRFLPALGLGPCGWAFPAAIGIAVAQRRPVVVVAGDGAFQFNIQELQTVVRHRVPVKIVIVDNASHGSVRQLQEKAFDGRYPATVLGYDRPDFARLAQAYGVPSMTVSEPAEVPAALRWLWREDASPALLHVLIATELNVYPNVPFGAPMTVMESMRPVSEPGPADAVKGLR